MLQLPVGETGTAGEWAEAGRNTYSCVAAQYHVGHDRGVSPRMLYIHAEPAVAKGDHGKALVEPSISSVLAVDEQVPHLCHVTGLVIIQHDHGNGAFDGVQRGVVETLCRTREQPVRGGEGAAYR